MNTLFSSHERKNTVLNEVRRAFLKIGKSTDIIKISYGYSICIGEYVEVITRKGTFSASGSYAEEMSENIRRMTESYRKK